MPDVAIRPLTIDAARAVMNALVESDLPPEYYPAALRIAEQLVAVDAIAAAQDDVVYADSPPPTPDPSLKDPGVV